MLWLINAYNFGKKHLIAFLGALSLGLYMLWRGARAHVKDLEIESEAHETTIDAFKAGYKARTQRDGKIKQAGQAAVDDPDFMNQDRL